MYEAADKYCMPSIFQYLNYWIKIHDYQYEQSLNGAPFYQSLAKIYHCSLEIMLIWIHPKPLSALGIPSTRGNWRLIALLASFIVQGS